jgi:2-methylcitrate dehydratase PrpD
MTEDPGTRNIDAIASFAATARLEDIPDRVIAAGRMCLVDWFGVALGAHDDPTAIAVRRAARAIWPGTGRSMVLLAEPAPAAAAALINGTMAHCLDYDDTHISSVAHLSGATLAAALAVGSEIGAPAERVLLAHICGFEVGARLGLGDFGSALNHRGWHSTGVLACLAATTAACIVHGLDEDRIRHALGAAATQVGGLTASFGTMAKPFHAGKAALNAILSVELARAGFRSQTELLESRGGLDSALVQDGSACIPAIRFDDDWELNRNTFKPSASCLLTHPVIDAARSLATRGCVRDIDAITAHVNPMTPKLAGKERVQTPLEGKFSTAFCVAMALRGHALTDQDFCSRTICDGEIAGLASKVRLVVEPDMPKVSARLSIEYADGGAAEESIEFALGNPENPMSAQDMRQKFDGLARPVLGDDTGALYALLAGSDRVCDLAAIEKMMRARAVDR